MSCLHSPSRKTRTSSSWWGPREKSVLRQIVWFSIYPLLFTFSLELISILSVFGPESCLPHVYTETGVSFTMLSWPRRAVVSQLLTKVSGLLLEPRKPNFEAAAKTADILNHLTGTSTCARGGRKSVGGFPRPAREIRGVKSKLGSLYSILLRFYSVFSIVCSSLLSLFCLTFVSILDWLMRG